MRQRCTKDLEVCPVAETLFSALKFNNDGCEQEKSAYLLIHRLIE
jgi:hypothetical protein